MRCFTSFVVVLVCFIPAGVSQEKPPAPKCERPRFFLAVATEKDGQLFIQLNQPGFEITPLPAKPGEEAPLKVEGKWEELKPLKLSKQVRVIGMDGKDADRKAILQAWAKPVLVTCFTRCIPTDPLEPNLLYMSVLKQDSLLLLVDDSELVPVNQPQAPKPTIVEKK